MHDSIVVLDKNNVTFKALEEKIPSITLGRVRDENGNLVKRQISVDEVVLRPNVAREIKGLTL